MNAIRLGMARGRIELRHMFTMPSELAQYYLPTVVFLVVLAFLRFDLAGDAGLSYGAVAVASVLGNGICFSGLTLMTQALASDREDGTLLRAKGLPNGTPAYLIGKTVLNAASTLTSAAIILVYALLLFRDVQAPDFIGWLKLVAVTAMGMLATMPLGAVLGSLFPNPRVSSMITIPLFLLLGISGIFFPITVLPHWVQSIAQAFPVYWLGLGMRSVLLPGSAVVAEIGHSWRDWQMFAVLGAWTVLGLVLAPIVLRRMTRRATGSRRGKAMRQGE